MNNLTILAVRALLGIVFAFILIRFFYPGARLYTVVGLGIVLVGLAYLFDYLRNRKSG
ncbi:MAG: hypothetical protein SWH61_09840 [Thermodesulfobacteriota bacterium]|nr:hypothetical protein [Thermodesulfobacteriota bacterium]